MAECHWKIASASEDANGLKLDVELRKIAETPTSDATFSVVLPSGILVGQVRATIDDAALRQSDEWNGESTGPSPSDKATAANIVGMMGDAS